MFKTFCVIAIVTLLSSCDTMNQYRSLEQHTTNDIPKDISGSSTINPVPLTNAPQTTFAPNYSRIALMVPLTGPDAALGLAMRNAAQLALFDLQHPAIELLPRDSGSTDAEAIHAAQDALQSGARLMIGPLRSGQTLAVQAVTSPSFVPVLSLSNDPSIVADNTYVMGFMPQTETEAVIAAAHARGVQHIVLLAPSNPYGDVVSNAARGTDPTISIMRYNPNGSDVATAIASVSAENSEAIMVADGGPPLRRILVMLHDKNITPSKQLLGTGLWDDPLVTHDPNARGALIPATDPKKWTHFRDEYKSVYKTAPPRLASLAYDATTLAAVLAKQPGSQNPYNYDALHDPAGFSGIDGAFYFDRTGHVVRALTVRIIGQD